MTGSTYFSFLNGKFLQIYSRNRLYMVEFSRIHSEAEWAAQGWIFLCKANKSFGFYLKMPTAVLRIHFSCTSTWSWIIRCFICSLCIGIESCHFFINPQVRCPRCPWETIIQTEVIWGKWTHLADLLIPWLFAYSAEVVLEQYKCLEKIKLNFELFPSHPIPSVQSPLKVSIKSSRGLLDGAHAMQ